MKIVRIGSEEANASKEAQGNTIRAINAMKEKVCMIFTFGNGNSIEVDAIKK